MKSVLITGGSGTFGRAFVKKLLEGPSVPDRIVIYSRGEHLQEEMEKEFSHPNLRFFIGDIRDKDRLIMALRDIEVIVHAAALKVVPKCELDPMEAIHTNIIGAQNVVKAALRTGVRKVVSLSTDKAVNPINLYGATKLAAEKLFTSANILSGNNGPRFSSVRYGNIIGSRGSVLPFFRSLVEKGEPLLITDERMTRFWYELDDAVELVLRAIKEMQGREIFIPKMPSIKVVDLAKALSNKPYHVVGIRPGEKIHETILTEDEARSTVSNHGIYLITPFSDVFSYGHPREGFRYSSDTNTDWLNVDQLREMLK